MQAISLKGAGATLPGVLQRFKKVVFLLVIFLLTTLCLQLVSTSLILSVNGQDQVVRTFSRNVAGALNEAGITVREEDNLSHSLNDRLQNGMTISVTKAFPVTIIVDDTEHMTWVPGCTVSELLLDTGINLGELDRVFPGPDEWLLPGNVVEVTRVWKQLVTERTEIPFQEIRRANEQLDRGETRILQRGRTGIREDTIELIMENGHEVSVNLIQSEIVRTKQDRIVEYGQNNILSRGDRTVFFNRIINVTATAYCPGTEGSGCPIDENGWSKCTGHYNDGVTASGIPAVPGSGEEADPHLVAVDQKVIPLGSKLYIDGYGFALAADVGGSITGNRIDILFAKHETALKFGRKSLRVYLLP